MNEADKPDDKKAGGKDAKKDEKKDDKPELPSFKMTGFLQLDTAWYSQEPENIATVGDGKTAPGFAAHTWPFKARSPSSRPISSKSTLPPRVVPSFFDNYVEQGNIPYLGQVRAGQFCQPFSVDALTGFRNLTFLEHRCRSSHWCRSAASA